MRTWIILACTAAMGFAADSPQFEVASVKPAAPLTPGGGVRVMSRGGPGSPDPSQVTYTNLTLKNLLATAYAVKAYQISGPGWLDTERYDIVAKIPPDATKEQFGVMLQNLLAERFKLSLHHETKDLPLFELVVSKNGSKLKPWVEDPNATPSLVPQANGPLPVGKDGFPKVPPGSLVISTSNGHLRLAASKQTVPRLADMLANQLGAPVVDKTGLAGEYDYTLEFSREGFGVPAPAPGGAEPGPAASGDEAPGLLTAVQEQLGLKLEQKKGPLDMLVIDKADKVPTEN